MSKKLIIAMSALLLAACATYQPIVDTKGVDMNMYHVDLGECQQYAGQLDPGAQAATGAVAGAILGAALGAILGNRHSAGQGAAISGLFGATAGAAQGAGAQRDIITRCMAGRGYRVLH